MIKIRASCATADELTAVARMLEPYILKGSVRRAEDGQYIRLYLKLDPAKITAIPGCKSADGACIPPSHSV